MNTVSVEWSRLVEVLLFGTLISRVTQKWVCQRGVSLGLWCWWGWWSCEGDWNVRHFIRTVSFCQGCCHFFYCCRVFLLTVVDRSFLIIIFGVGRVAFLLRRWSIKVSGFVHSSGVRLWRQQAVIQGASLLLGLQTIQQYCRQSKRRKFWFSDSRS